MPDPVVIPGEPVVVAPVVPALPSDGGPAAGLLAGKFANAEELAKGYSNLATLLGKQGKLDDAQLAALVAKLPAPAVPAAAVAAPVVPAVPAVAPENPLQIPAAAAAAVASAGLNLEDMNAEYAKEGKLSDASYEKLGKVGISKDVVAAFITGQDAIRSQVEQKAYAAVGGEVKFKQMIEWAKTGFTHEEGKAFNDAIIGTPAAHALALTSLKARFEAAEGSDPALVRGSVSGGAGGYESNAQIRADMKDPRYKKDPAYREAVQAKVSRSGPLA